VKLLADRNLFCKQALFAGRSAAAAREIKDLVQDSVKEVEDASVPVTQSGQRPERIVASA
jgi:methyl-accepting chemotaxis protein